MSEDKIIESLDLGFANIVESITSLQTTLKNTNRHLEELVYILHKHTGVENHTDYYRPV